MDTFDSALVELKTDTNDPSFFGPEVELLGTNMALNLSTLFLHLSIDPSQLLKTSWATALAEELLPSM